MEKVCASFSPVHGWICAVRNRNWENKREESRILFIMRDGILGLVNGTVLIFCDQLPDAFDLLLLVDFPEALCGFGEVGVS